MSIRLSQRQSQANKSFDMSAGARQQREYDHRETPPARHVIKIEDAHEVHIDSQRSTPLAEEIVHKRSNAATSNFLEIHESNTERVSALLTRLRNLATTKGSEEELSSRDQLAAEDEYRALQKELDIVSHCMDESASESDLERKKLANDLHDGLNQLKEELGIQFANGAGFAGTAKSPNRTSRSAAPVLGKLNDTIGKVVEYQSYLQQLRSAVDTQLMKPIGQHKESNEKTLRHQIISRLSDSKRQILESGTDSLRSTKALDPAVALQLLNSSD